MDKMSNYKQFCESMTAAMNLHALMHGDCMVTVEQVMTWEQAHIAFQSCICIAQTAS